MTSRFISNISTFVLGAILGALSLVLSPGVLRWVALGIGSASVAITLVAFAFRGRGGLQRLLDVAIALLGGWTILAACAFAGSALRWLTFSEAAALCGLALVGLIAHELLMEREARRFLRLASVDGAAPIAAAAPAGQLAPAPGRGPARVAAW